MKGTSQLIDLADCLLGWAREALSKEKKNKRDVGLSSCGLASAFSGGIGVQEAARLDRLAADQGYAEGQ